jgi:hypothetical protein
MATGELLTTDRIQYWINIGTIAEPEYVRVTEDPTFDPAVDLSNYAPSYKDRMNQPEYVTGKKTTVEFAIDLIDGQELQEWFQENEHGVNITAELIRVKMYKEVMDGETATGTYEAVRASFVMNQNPIDGAAGEALQATGTLTMTSAGGWEAGVFDPVNATFTPEAGDEEGEG